MCLCPIARPLFAILVLSAMISACGRGEDNTTSSNARAQVESALNAFAADLVAHPPTNAELPSRIQSYVAAHPDFFGSTVALIGDDGHVSYSPYVYRLNGGLAEKDLVTPQYDIDHQGWLAEPRDSRQATWTDPYFDAGGGEIWMVTRSVPLLRNGAVYAVATTDLPVAPPPGA